MAYFILCITLEFIKFKGKGDRAGGGGGVKRDAFTCYFFGFKKVAGG